MVITISKMQLKKLLLHQLKSFFFIPRNEVKCIAISLNDVLDRCEYCFSQINNKYYRNNENDVLFNPSHSGQYSIFLYYYSHHLRNKKSIAEKIYYLNKVLHCCDLFFEIQLPEVFFLEHPLGAVLGRANYGNRFSFQQNCTVGNNKGIYPEIGNNVRMFANSSIIGESHIGNNVLISSNTHVKDQNIPDNSIVFGSSPNLLIKSKNESSIVKHLPFISETM